MESRSEPSVVDGLVLARLLVAGDKGATLANVRRDLKPLMEHRWSGGELDERIERSLAASGEAGLVETRRGKKTASHIATSAGRREALRFLKLDALPAKATWAKIKKPYLLAKVFNLPPATKDAALKAALVIDRFGLTARPTDRAAKVADALAWKRLGFDSDRPFNAKNVLGALLARETGASRPVDGKVVVERLLARELDARNSTSGELFDAALRRWIDRTEGAAETPPPAPSPTSPIPRAPAGMPEPPGPGARAEPRPSTIGATAASPPMDLPAFARRVQAAAERTTTGHFGDNKVFISHVWRTLRSDPDLNGMSMEDFKRRLGEANNARLLDLSRADLVQAMDPQDIRESEVAYYGATYHFVRL